MDGRLPTEKDLEDPNRIARPTKPRSAVDVVAGYGKTFVAVDPSHPLYVGPPTITRNQAATVAKHKAKAARRAAKAQRLVAEGKL